jgi:hypothetical protein
MFSQKQKSLAVEKKPAGEKRLISSYVLHAQFRNFLFPFSQLRMVLKINQIFLENTWF